jgi:hypothetical protein
MLVLIAAGTMHPQVIQCASAVRSHASTAAACSEPKMVVVPQKGEPSSIPLTNQCAAALLAGRAVEKVPLTKTDLMRSEFERKMQACENSVSQAPAKPNTRDTVKLWD